MLVFQYILIAFAAVGGLLAIMLLLSIVLACCYAQQVSRNEEIFQDPEVYEHRNLTLSRPGTPQSHRSHHYTTQSKLGTTC